MRKTDDAGWVQAGSAASSVIKRIATQNGYVFGTETPTVDRNPSVDARQSTVRGAQSPAGRPAR